MSKIVIDPSKLPKSCRLKVGKKYLTLSQPNVRVPLEWDLVEQPLFGQFLEYWTRKGYYEKFAVVIAAGKDINELMPCFDFIIKNFKCNYRIKNTLVKFDSAILKYTMLGLGFNKKSDSTTKTI